MLKIRRSSNGQVVFRIIGRMQAERIADLEELLKSEDRDRQIVLDLKDLTLVDRDTVRFFERCEKLGIRLESCPAYIREWIARERGER